MSDDVSSGLSVGAQAGVGVSVGIVGVSIISIATWLFLRRKRQSASSPPEMDGSTTATHSQDDKNYPAGVSSPERYELSCHNDPSELETHWQPYAMNELESPANKH